MNPLVAFLRRMTLPESLSQYDREHVDKKASDVFFLQEFKLLFPESDVKRAPKTCLLEALAQHGQSETMDQVTKHLNQVVSCMIPNVNSLASYLTELNNAVGRKFGQGSVEHRIARSNLKLNKYSRILRNKERQKHGEEKMNFKVELFMSDVLSLIADGLASSDWMLKFGSLCLASGARKIEILLKSVSRFEEWIPPPAVSEDQKGTPLLRQVGVAKDKRALKTRNGSAKIIDKPVIGLTASEFVNQVHSLRQIIEAKFPSMAPFMQEDEPSEHVERIVTTHFHPAPMERIRKAFMERQVVGAETLTFHDLRAIYANASYELFGRGLNPLTWVQNVLGHTDVMTSVTYHSVKIKVGLSADPVDLKSEVSVLQSKVMELQKALESSSSSQKATQEQVQEAIRFPFGKVTMINKEGQPVEMAKQSRAYDGGALRRMEKSYVELKATNVHITQNVFRRLNYGSAAINAFWKSHPELRHLNLKRHREPSVDKPSPAIDSASIV